MSRAELILYATPVGSLADAIDRVFERLATTGPTTAQTYPPHCTLTGFFQRDTDEIPRLCAELERALAAIGPPPAEAVRVVGLHRRADWVGLEIASDWLHELTARFIELHRRGDGDDAVRAKDWLHLSIGYGIDDLSAAIDETADFDAELSVDWEIGLWQRHDKGSWTRHG